MNTSKASLPTGAVLASPNTARFMVDKGIPVPAKAAGRPSVYPFATMEIGDSFFVPGDSRKLVNSLARTAHYHAQKSGKKFATRMADGGARVWRIAGDKEAA